MSSYTANAGNRWLLEEEDQKFLKPLFLDELSMLILQECLVYDMLHVNQVKLTRWWRAGPG